MDCARRDVADERDSRQLGGALPIGATIYRPVGCPSCKGDGYRGRAGLYELVVVDEAMQAQIHDGASEAELTRAAREHGPGLLDDGVAKIIAGVTSIDEVVRVTRDEG